MNKQTKDIQDIKQAIKNKEYEDMYDDEEGEQDEN